MPSSNPAFRNMEAVINGQQAAPSAEYLDQLYHQPAYQKPPVQTERLLTLDDVVTKTATLLGTAIVAGAITAYFQAYALAIPAAIVGFVLAMIVIFKRSTSPALIVPYAIVEGVLLGAITAVFEDQWAGIAIQAILATVGVFVGMLVVYKTGVIRVTPKFTKMLIGGMVGVLILMVGNLVLGGLFGINMGLRDGSTTAIIFSIVCIAIAAFSFMLDFEAIDQAIKQNAPAKTAWYFSFGLMVTLVWLYLEILRLLGYMRSD